MSFPLLNYSELQHYSYPGMCITLPIITYTTKELCLRSQHGTNLDVNHLGAGKMWSTLSAYLGATTAMDKTKECHFTGFQHFLMAKEHNSRLW